MIQIQLGKEIDFDKKEIQNFIEENHYNLDGDTQRNLTIRKEYSNHFLIGYFDDYKKAYIQAISKPDEYTEDGDEPEFFRLVLPVECIFEKNIQTEPLIKLELFEGNLNEEEFFAKQRKVIKKEIEEMERKIKKKNKLMNEFSNLILNTILNKNYYNQDKIGQKYTYIINEERLKEKSKLFSDIIPLYKDKDLKNYYSILQDISNIKYETYKIGKIYEEMDIDIIFDEKNKNLTLTFKIIKDDNQYD